MSEQKAPPLRPALDSRRGPALEPRPGPARNVVATNEQQGWDAYRKWLSRLGRPPVERSAVDPSIYSWKGYNNWAERVRQNWKPEDT